LIEQMSRAHQSSQDDKFWNGPLIRWIAVIPAAIVAAALTSLATNLLAAIMGSGGGTWFGLEVTSNNPDSEISKGLGFHLMKYILQPAAIAYSSVYAARWIAPAHKQIVGWLFACVPFVVALWLYSFVGKLDSGHLGFGIWLILLSHPIGGIIGAATKLER